MSILSEFAKNTENYLENTHKNVSLAWGGFFFILVGGIDYLVTPEISLAVFYLLPIAILTWFVRLEAGLISSFLSAIAQSILNPVSQPTVFGFLAPYWNTAVILIFLLTVSYLLFELRRIREKEKESARLDQTTGVANKRLFFELAWLEVKKANRYRHPLTVIYIDVDDLKSINDTWGRRIGDKLLQTAAETLKQNIRETDILGRIGCDEFAIILPGSGYEPARIVIARVQKELLAAMQKYEWSVTFSISAITFLNPPNSVEEMLQPADHLMYLIKNKGKNQFEHKISA